MENPYSIGETVILLDDIMGSYGEVIFLKGTEVEIESLWQSDYGMYKQGIIIKQNIFGQKFGTRIENIKPTLKTIRDRNLREIIDGSH